MERLVVDGDGEGGVVLVVDADEGAAQPHAAPPLAARHLRLRGVVRKDARGVVEHEPPDYSRRSLNSTFLYKGHPIFGKGTYYIDFVLLCSLCQKQYRY